MTGNAPQPGETSRAESEPWSLPDPNTAWWRVELERDRAEALAEVAAARPRHPRRRPGPGTANGASLPAAYGGSEAEAEPDQDAAPAFAPEAFDAHAAGVQDTAEALEQTRVEQPPALALEQPPAALVEAEQEARIEQVEAVAAAQAVQDAKPEPEPVERDHHRRPRDRYLPPGEKSPEDKTEGYAVSTADEARADTTGTPDTDRSAPEDRPAATDAGQRAEGVPDVMVLPEPSANRPTVALDRRPVPGQSSSATSRLAKVADEAKRDRLENHPFWLNEEPEMRQRLATGTADGRGKPPAKKPVTPRGPVAGLLGLVVLALVATFFSWVSAEPFWLAVGHGDRGVATVSRCIGDGVTQRCQGSFAAADGGYAIERVTLLGVDANSRNTGAVAPARMVSPDSRQAYVGGTGWLLHLRWTLGFVLVLLCGYGIAGMTGARRLETAKARRSAVLISLAGPVLLLCGFLAAAY